jgi:hypothetical protein
MTPSNDSTWEGQLSNIRNDNQATNEGALVSCLCPLHQIIPHYHIHGSGHAPCRDLTCILLHSHSLPIYKGALLREKSPIAGIATVRVVANRGLRVLELLFHGANNGEALITTKGTDQEFWTDFTGACDGAIDGHQLSNLVTRQITQSTSMIKETIH